ncbi:hypothetical protein K1719_003102 [Acacia pycnantha]|nr:hypothetical protein K1719_003102 [Acacia pycnantha]
MGEGARSEGERAERTDDDGRGRGDGDGGGPGHEKGRMTGEQFVFGSGRSMGNIGVQNQESLGGVRRPVSQSYREKLLSPGGLGFLVSHGEADDIVSGWKSFFAKQRVESEEGEGREEGNVSDDDMGDLQSSRYPVLSVTSEQYTSWCKPWMNSVIIKVLGLSVPKHVLIDRVRRMWKPKQPLKVVPVSNEFYIVSFSSKEDRDYAYYEGPWMIDDHYLLVQRWRPNFNPRKADGQKKVAVWVRIPDLPMEFCTVEALGMIGNMIGRIIKIDRSTSIYDKGEFARICVEVDLQKPLLPAFTVFGEHKQLVYEGLHLVCFKCGLYGHAQESCGQKKSGAGEQKINEDVGTHGCRQPRSTVEQDGDVAGKDSDGHSNPGVHDPKVVLEAGKKSNREDMADGQNSQKGPTKKHGPKEKQIPSVHQGVPGGDDYLGPQMVLSRDWRRDINGPAGNKDLGKSGGIVKLGGGKSGITILAQEKGIRETNLAGLKGSGTVYQKSGHVEGAIFGAGKKAIADHAKNNPEWVAVGSKRKQEVRPKGYGKENKVGGRPNVKVRVKGKSVGPCMELKNSFNSLQDNNASEGPISPSTLPDHVKNGGSVVMQISQELTMSKGADPEVVVDDAEMEGNLGGPSGLPLVGTTVDNGLGHGLGLDPLTKS